MQYGTTAKELSAYQSVGVHSSIEDASPHRIIQMLLEGAIDKIALAKGFMERNEKAECGSHISWAMSIIDGLRMSLDKDIGGDLVTNLDALYEYMNAQLVQANLQQQTSLLDEVISLLKEIQAGWDAIPESMQQAPRDSLMQNLPAKKT